MGGGQSMRLPPFHKDAAEVIEVLSSVAFPFRVPPAQDLPPGYHLPFVQNFQEASKAEAEMLRP
jgi:hypothetical protein